MSAEEHDELVLPLGRVRRLMKDAAHIRAVTQEASLLVSAATKLFLETLTARALECKTGDGKLAFSDLAAAVAATDRLDFLADVVPRKRAAGEVVASLCAEAREAADDATRCQ